MELGTSLIEHLNERLTRRPGPPLSGAQVTAIPGGSINDAYRLDSDRGSFFLKTNIADRYPSYFEAEVDGLERLRSTGAINVPKVIAQGSFEQLTYLVLEFIPPGSANTDFWCMFGEQLAALHRTTSDLFGLDRPNYIGTLQQVNTQETEWSEFVIKHRLEPLVRSGRDSGKLDGGTALRFERLFGKLNAEFPIEPPAMLHGDLWHGNFLCPEKGDAVLVDPAVYFGHREMDLAMTRLFGGFDKTFYETYQRSWPLEEGWEQRAELCNLYPLMVHFILFGGGYLEQVRSVLKRWT